MVLLVVSSAFAQYDTAYVASKSGDTLVVKDDIAYGGTNTLYSLMASDSEAPATRVYELTNGGIYSLVNNPVTSSTYRTIIMGPTQTSLKVSKGAAPPILSGSYATGVNTDGGTNVGKDLLIKNCDLEIGNSAGNAGGWAWFGFNGPNMRLQVDNCILEHTWWVWVGGPPANESCIFTNDYFVNLGGQSCRRNGGVIDPNGSAPHQDTILAENCTHVNTQGSIYKSRPGYSIDRMLFNHNDFIDCAGFVFMNSAGDVSNYSVTNNIFVNVQLQGFCPLLSKVDVGEVDQDNEPMGLVNVRDDSLFDATGASFYADANLVYWDPSLADIVSTLNTSKVNGQTNWVSQMIVMNSRTDSAFANKSKYPHLTSRGWIQNVLPAFSSTNDLLTTQLAVVKAFAIATVDTNYGTPLTSWRTPADSEAANFIYADWPIPINLSYTDANLMTGGLNGYPIGDLDWFPTQYASWNAQQSLELSQIDSVLKGTKVLAVHSTVNLPSAFALQQNYPNPFNPTTQINYSVKQNGYTTLKVYNALGQEVASLFAGNLTAGSHIATFNGSRFASGVYFYTLRNNGNSVTKKMVLLK